MLQTLNNYHDIGYQITGGRPVKGKISCLGAKNFATKAMVAALLGDDPTTLTNVPNIGDVQLTIDMLKAIGVNIKYLDTDILWIDPSAINSAQVPLPDSGSNRIPILLLGTLLHRFREASVPVLGGCNIGKRPVDYHIQAIESFGAKILTTEEGYTATKNSDLTGVDIRLPYPSVGATETSLFLSVLAKGRSVISNAAIEPEIMELITMLRSMGAIIFTSPGREIIVDGVQRLRGTRITVLGDRIEAASWACLACATNGNITVEGIRPEILGNFLSYFQQIGGGIELISQKTLRFFKKDNLLSTTIETDVYPGFSTDWQQPFAILLTQAEGVSVIHETVYEKRFGYLKSLNKLGARTQLTNACLGSTNCRYRNKGFEHSAIIIGPTHLEAIDSIAIPDLRAGLAYLIAAATASGTTLLTGIGYLQRGYGDIISRLANMDLEIREMKLPSSLPTGEEQLGLM